MSIGAGAVQATSPPPEQQVQRREFVANNDFSALSRGSDGGTKTSAIEVLRAELGDSVRVVNEKLAHRGQSLDIGVDPSTGAVVVKVSDDKTGEVVRQIPSEDALRVARNIEALTGILVDHRE
jgi:flagellar protein FlaG